jgi:hypothetical protein
MFRDRAAKQAIAVDTASPGPAPQPAVTVLPHEPMPATYPVDDLLALDNDDVAALLERARADQEAGTPSCAHLVITRDLRTGVVNHYVPCVSGAEALRLATDVAAEKLASDPQREFTVTVTPLLPH